MVMATISLGDLAAEYTGAERCVGKTGCQHHVPYQGSSRPPPDSSAKCCAARPIAQSTQLVRLFAGEPSSPSGIYPCAKERETSKLAPARHVVIASARIDAPRGGPRLGRWRPVRAGSDCRNRDLDAAREASHSSDLAAIGFSAGAAGWPG